MRKLVLLIVLTVLAVGTAAAQNQTSTETMNPGLVPGDAFYPVEKFVESIELTVASSPLGSPELEAKVRANKAEERLSEARKLISMNRMENVPGLMKEYEDQIGIAANMSRDINSTEFSDRLKEVNSNHRKVLEEVQQKVPGQAKDSIQKAIDRSSQRGKNIGRPRGSPPAGKDVPGNSRSNGTDTLPGKQTNEPREPDKPVEPENNTQDLNNTLEEGSESLDQDNDSSGNLTDDSDDLEENTSSLGSATGKFKRTVPGQN